MKNENFQDQNEVINSFEQQFATREHYQVAGGQAEVIDIKPTEQKSELPVLFSPSWGLTEKTYEPALKDLSERGRRAVLINHPRWGGKIKQDPNYQENDAEKYPQEQLRRALNILGVLDQKEIEKTDAICHSEGAIYTAIAAVLHPERFRNIVFFNPAGLIGEDTFLRLMKGFAGQNKRVASMNSIPVTEIEKQVVGAAVKDVIAYFIKNPLRAIREAKGISESQIHEILRYLHEKGLGIVVVASVDDPVFPMDKIQNTVKADMLDGFLSVRGGHSPIGEHPELYMAAGEQMLSALEEKEKKSTNSNQ